MYSDTEMLDWLSKQHTISFEKHYQGLVSDRTEAEKLAGGYDGTIDFFSIPSQHINSCPNLREAICKAMQAELEMILKGQDTLWGSARPNPHCYKQTGPRLFHS